MKPPTKVLDNSHVGKLHPVNKYKFEFFYIWRVVLVILFDFWIKLNQFCILDGFWSSSISPLEKRMYRYGNHPVQIEQLGVGSYVMCNSYCRKTLKNRIEGSRMWNLFSPASCSEINYSIPWLRINFLRLSDGQTTSIYLPSIEGRSIIQYLVAFN